MVRGGKVVQHTTPQLRWKIELVDVDGGNLLKLHKCVLGQNRLQNGGLQRLKAVAEQLETFVRSRRRILGCQSIVSTEGLHAFRAIPIKPVVLKRVAAIKKIADRLPNRLDDVG